MLPATDEPTSNELRAKIAIFGPWLGQFGFAQHARQFSAALAKIESISVVPLDLPLKAAARDVPPVKYGIGVGIGTIESMLRISAQYRIGFVVWETTVVPAEKLRILRELDEIWVPSHWGRRVFLENGLAGDKVHVVPEGVDASLFRPAESTAHPVQETSRPFRFLCVAKWEVRKGIADLAIAFAREFPPDAPVELILHCSDPVHRGFDAGSALETLHLPPHAPIRISKPRPLSALPALYTSCDVLVLPTKAEGWGLPILEALSCGIPAIATNYSAHTDFLTDNNGYLVNVAEMCAARDPAAYQTYEPMGVWAQPDLKHLQAQMRRSFENREERIHKGLRDRGDVLQRWTWDHAARIALQRLRAI